MWLGKQLLSWGKWESESRLSSDMLCEREFLKRGRNCKKIKAGASITEINIEVYFQVSSF